MQKKRQALLLAARDLFLLIIMVIAHVFLQFPSNKAFETEPVYSAENNINYTQYMKPHDSLLQIEEGDSILIAF